MFLALRKRQRRAIQADFITSGAAAAVAQSGRTRLSQRALLGLITTHRSLPICPYRRHRLPVFCSRSKGLLPNMDPLRSIRSDLRQPTRLAM